MLGLIFDNRNFKLVKLYIYGRFSSIDSKDNFVVNKVSLNTFCFSIATVNYLTNKIN